MPEHRPPAKHGPPPKGPKGPKERELAVALTVAALGAARIDEPLDAIAQKTLEIYDTMLAAVTKRAPDDRDRGD